MEKTILIGGKAGQGTNVTSYFIGEVFSSSGYYVFNYRDYPSLIRGGHNFNVLKVSDKPVYSHGDKYDLIVALDQETIDRHVKGLKEGGFVLGNRDLKTDKKFHSVDIKPILEKLNAPAVIENDVLIGWLFKHFGMSEEFLMKELEERFGGDKIDIIKESAKIGYGLAEKREDFRKLDGQKYFISGNKAVSAGALASGIDVYIAYPMTPATPVLHHLAAEEREKNILVLQLENEIAVANAALGASFAGARTMVGTSGGGFALMGEAMSMAGIGEIPLVAYLAQRTGPASGVPTYTAQADLKFAVNAGHGEFTRIVVAPGDPQEAIIRTQEAFYLANKYRNLVILVSDKHLAESDYTFDRLEKSPLPNHRFIEENPMDEFKGYEITQDGNSPRIVPGQASVAKVTSYEHDEYGNTREEGEWMVKMTDKRAKKEETLAREIMERFEPVKVHGEGRNLVVGWGSTKGAILDALKGLEGYRFMQVSYISPFPAEMVRKELENSDKIVLVENNSTGQLGDIIAEKTGFVIKNKVLQYDARPFIPETIIKKVKQF